MQTLCRPRARALTSCVNVATSTEEPKMTPRIPENIRRLVTVMGGNTIPPRHPNDDDDEDEENDDEEDEDLGEENRRSSENPTNSCCAHG